MEMTNNDWKKELELPDQLLAIARAGAGVNNIPLDKCETGS